MLKLCGCICILLASSGMAYSCVLGLREQLSLMEQLLELLTALEGEITYTRRPLPELLQHLSKHMPEPYCSLLMQSSRRMEDNNEADIPSLWKAVCEEARGQFPMPGEAYQVLLRVGDVFSYTSLEASLQLLRIGQKTLATLIASGRGEFSAKRKLYCCLCYMAGMFLIVLLV